MEPRVVLAGHVGPAALAVGTVAFIASIVYYAREGAVLEALPFHPVRLFGALNALLAVLLRAARALFFQFHPGPAIPVGAALAAVFAYLLLTVELASVSDGDAEEEREDE
jgi:uncharacterized protein (TIGR04206 family)